MGCTISRPGLIMTPSLSSFPARDVTATIIFGERHLVPIALVFLKEQPEINLRLSLVDRQLSPADEHVDVALRIWHLADSVLIVTAVGTVHRVICATPTISPAEECRVSWMSSPSMMA